MSVLEFRRQSVNHLAGVGAQYDSELVYHNVHKAEVAAQGVVYTDLESAYARGIRRYDPYSFYEAGKAK